MRRESWYKSRSEYDAELMKACLAVLERSAGRSPSRRQTLAAQERNELLRIVHPECPDNPWETPFTRCRNYVIIVLLLATGMRRGELLALRVRDVKFQQGCIEIRRRQDDKRDPRRRQPLVKTAGRSVSLNAEMLRILERYLSEFRGSLQAARKHGFLFVSRDGPPLSMSALSLLFRTLRVDVTGLGPVSAHVLRHVWNEDFSDNADRTGMSDTEERRLRSEVMGWSERSKMPEYHLRRKTKRKADQASREMQDRMMRLGTSEAECG